MSEAEAKTLMETCLKVMFQRDKKAIDRMQIGTITKKGVTIGAAYQFNAWKDFKFHHEQSNEFYRPMRANGITK